MDLGRPFRPTVPAAGRISEHQALVLNATLGRQRSAEHDARSIRGRGRSPVRGPIGICAPTARPSELATRRGSPSPLGPPTGTAQVVSLHVHRERIRRASRPGARPVLAGLEPMDVEGGCERERRRPTGPSGQPRRRRQQQPIGVRGRRDGHVDGGAPLCPSSTAICASEPALAGPTTLLRIDTLLRSQFTVPFADGSVRGPSSTQMLRSLRMHHVVHSVRVVRLEDPDTRFAAVEHDVVGHDGLQPDNSIRIPE